jgi:GWxTD domain-containing protein
MKMNGIHIIWLIVLLQIIIKIPAFTQTNFTKKSLDWKYNLETEYQINHRIARDDSLYHIYFAINLPKDIDFEENIGLDYEIKASLEAEEILLTRTINYPVHGAGMDAESRFFHVKVPDANNFNVMFLNVKNKVSGRSYTVDIPFVSAVMYPPPDFIIFNKTTSLPECRDYTHISDSLILYDLTEDNIEYFVYYYSTDFDVADPPMYRLKKSVSKSMEIDSTFTISAGSAFVLKKEGLYYIQSDTSSLSGIGIRVENDFYPKMTSINQVIEPIIYLSTKEEIDKLLNSDDIRKSFGTFWLDMTKSEASAKLIIKDYFDRIEEANLLFTNYKEGWKTDRGMIYIIVGPPDEVYRTEEKESWYYKNPGKNQIVVFNFLNLKNLFSDKHYMLIRDNQYKSFWFKSIDNWRKGGN